MFKAGEVSGLISDIVTAKQIIDEMVGGSQGFIQSALEKATKDIRSDNLYYYFENPSDREISLLA